MKVSVLIRSKKRADEHRPVGMIWNEICELAVEIFAQGGEGVPPAFAALCDDEIAVLVNWQPALNDSETGLVFELRDVKPDF